MVEIIKKTHLFAIATSHEFKSWLVQYDKSIYDDMNAKLGVNAGFKRTTEVMEDVVKRVNAAKLADFILITFPNAANPELMRRILWALQDIHDQILTIPMRKVVYSIDDLREAQREHPGCKHVTMGNISVVEWVPDQYKHLVDRLPNSAWLHRRLSLDMIINL